MSKRLNIKEILERTVKHFEKYEIHNARLDAELLLADLLGLERIQLYVRFDQPLTQDEIDEYRRRVIMRSRRIPTQYILGHQEFMSLDFKVARGVLIPRPETEHLVETVLEYVEEEGLETPMIVEVGTGSGAITVSLAHYLSNARVIGIDISKTALEVTRENAKKHDVQDRIKLVQGSFLEPLANTTLQIDIIASNPPYIRQQDLADLQPEVQYEPREALDGGTDGLEAYRQIIAQADILKPGGLLIFEVGINQSEAVASLMEETMHKISIRPDLAGIDRVVMGCKR